MTAKTGVQNEIGVLRDVIGNFPLFSERFFRIYDKNRTPVMFRLNRVQAHLFSRLSGRDLVLKSRQQGVTALCSGLGMYRALTTSDTIRVLADKEDNAKIVRQLYRDLLSGFGKELPRPVTSTNSDKRIVFDDMGSTVDFATAGAETAGRGASTRYLHGTEVAFWEKAGWVIAGALQGVPYGNGTQVILETTANGAQGWFYDEYRLAMKGDSTWKAHFYAWWWTAEYRIPLEKEDEGMQFTDEEAELVREHGLVKEQIKWRRWKMLELRDKFQQEFPESAMQAFINRGGGVFSVRNDNFYRDELGYIKGHEYVAGIDWGMSNDYTAVSVVDATEYREVEIVYFNRMDFREQVARIVELCKKWRIILVKSETNALGAPLTQSLLEALEGVQYDNGDGVALEGFYTTSHAKRTLVQTMKVGLQEGYKLVKDDIARRELEAYTQRMTASGAYSFSAPSNEHDDTVMARMLAHIACLGVR